jgi:hypothetical protein
MNFHWLDISDIKSGVGVQQGVFQLKMFYWILVPILWR